MSKSEKHDDIDIDKNRKSIRNKIIGIAIILTVLSAIISSIASSFGASFQQIIIINYIMDIISIIIIVTV